MRLTARRAGLMASAIVLAVIAGALAWVYLRPHAYTGLLQKPPAPAPDFTLVDERGQPFTLSTLRGRWVLLVYGYTTCPDVCPATLAILRQARAELGPDAEQVQVVFVSVDPERDTPEVMGQYVAHFDPTFHGLTGTPEAVAQAAAAYGVIYQRRAAASAVGYLVNHSAYVYVIDPAFRWRLTFPFGARPAEVAEDLRYLIHHPLPEEA
jgi:protein SCO1/2